MNECTDQIVLAPSPSDWTVATGSDRILSRGARPDKAITPIRSFGGDRHDRAGVPKGA
jgi:hypothetical protein